jgi:hypothetical protein
LPLTVAPLAGLVKQGVTVYAPPDGLLEIQLFPAAFAGIWNGTDKRFTSKIIAKITLRPLLFELLIRLYGFII